MRRDARSALVAVLFAGSACYSMQKVTLADLSSGERTRVWVTHADKTVVRLDDAQEFRGKLVGFAEGKYVELTPEDVHAMQVRKLSAGRTIGLVALGIATFAAGAALASGTEDYFDDCVGDDECDDGSM